jgi:alpha-beta hydrolase superfamily lysophospholipase
VQAQPAPPGGRGVLYLHGFVDYFFQEHVAEVFTQRGYAFHALDLRKCGRSLRVWQHANACRSVGDYYEEIGAAIDRIEADGVRDLTLIGHSTGGLTACLYAAEGGRREAIRRVVLNSPFFEFSEPAPMRWAAGQLAARLADSHPYATLPKGLSPMVGQSLHKDYHGEWDYSLAWKPIDGFPAFLCWVRAIQEGQKRLQQGLDLRVPVLLLHSDRSVKAGNVWKDDFLSSDSVLNVEHMKRYGPGLGRDVTMVEIVGGMHDLFLSRREVRERALSAVFDWLEREAVPKRAAA